MSSCITALDGESLLEKFKSTSMEAQFQCDAIDKAIGAACYGDRYDDLRTGFYEKSCVPLCDRNSGTTIRSNG